MTRPVHNIPLHLEIIGEPATGIWCDQCLLPAAVTVEVGVFTYRGSLLGPVGTVTRCPDCEQWAVPADEEDPTRDDHDNIGW